jgi:hypothetical protein
LENHGTAETETGFYPWEELNETVSNINHCDRAGSVSAVGSGLRRHGCRTRIPGQRDRALSALTREEQEAEMQWFIDAAAPFQGMEIKVVSETITTHEYESQVLAPAFTAITGIRSPMT